MRDKWNARGDVNACSDGDRVVHGGFVVDFFLLQVFMIYLFVLGVHEFADLVKTIARFLPMRDYSVDLA